MAVLAFDQTILYENTVDETKEAHRPAVETEAYDFSLIYPSLPRGGMLAARGSFAMYDGGQRVAVLLSGSDGRYLFGRWFDYRWYRDYRFLFVRK